MASGGGGNGKIASGPLKGKMIFVPKTVLADAAQVAGLSLDAARQNLRNPTNARFNSWISAYAEGQQANRTGQGDYSARPRTPGRSGTTLPNGTRVTEREILALARDRKKNIDLIRLRLSQGDASTVQSLTNLRSGKSTKEGIGSGQFTSERQPTRQPNRNE